MIVTKITISYFKYCCDDIKVHEDRAGIEDRGDQRCCHDRRVKPDLLRHERKDAADTLRHRHDRDHRHAERHGEHQISVIHDAYPDPVDNSKESAHDKRHSDLFEYHLKNIRKFNLSHSQPADDKG